jgi:hypothetical protein
VSRAWAGGMVKTPSQSAHQKIPRSSTTPTRVKRGDLQTGHGSLAGGLSHLPPHRPTSPDRQAGRFEFLFQLQEALA